MKATKAQVSLALRLWVFACVFVVPFVDLPWLGLCIAVGAALGLWWRSLPEDPPEPAPRLPFQDEYERDRLGR